MSEYFTDLVAVPSGSVRDVVLEIIPLRLVRCNKPQGTAFPGKPAGIFIAKHSGKFQT